MKIFFGIIVGFFSAVLLILFTLAYSSDHSPQTQIRSSFLEKIDRKIAVASWNAPKNFLTTLKAYDSEKVVEDASRQTSLVNADVIFVFIENEEQLEEFPLTNSVEGLQKIYKGFKGQSPVVVTYDFLVGAEQRSIRFGIMNWESMKNEFREKRNLRCLAYTVYSDIIFDDVSLAHKFKNYCDISLLNKGN